MITLYVNGLLLVIGTTFAVLILVVLLVAAKSVWENR